MICDFIRKLEMFGYVTDDLQGKAGTKVIVRTEEVIDAARNVIAKVPSTDTHRLVNRISVRSLQRKY